MKEPACAVGASGMKSQALSLQYATTSSSFGCIPLGVFLVLVPHPLLCSATGDVFFATSNSALRRARYSSSEPASWQTTTVIGGSAKVQVSGYNLGASLDDVVSFSIRGVECSNLRRESSNRLLCVSGDLAITNLGEVNRWSGKIRGVAQVGNMRGVLVAILVKPSPQATRWIGLQAVYYTCSSASPCSTNKHNVLVHAPGPNETK